jgi:hypothetical protein
MKNSKTLTVCAALFPFLMMPASALELRIYSTFSEFRTPVTLNTPEFRLDLNPETMSQMVAGTLRLEGLPVVSQIIRYPIAIDRLKSFEGQTVILRENDKRIPVKLINSAEGLVQEIDTGNYRYGVTLANLSFPSVPAPQPIQTSNFFLTERAGPATVSYLSRGVTWFPRYVLDVDADGKAVLESWANIVNNTSSDLQVDQSQLVAGKVKVNLESSSNNNGIYLDFTDFGRAFSAKSSNNVNETPIETIGIYIFSLNTGFFLAAKSSYLLPFIKPKIELERLVKLQEVQNYNNRQDPISIEAHKVYRFSSDALLPSGGITIRESGNVVGQDTIPDTAKTANVDLDTGRDPGLVIIRKSDKTFLESKEEPCNGYSGNKCTISYYNNTTSLKLTNTKDRPVIFEYRTAINYFSRLEGVGKMENSSNYFLRGTLPANSSQTFEYNLITRGQ